MLKGDFVEKCHMNLSCYFTDMPNVNVNCQHEILISYIIACKCCDLEGSCLPYPITYQPVILKHVSTASYI